MAVPTAIEQLSSPAAFETHAEHSGRSYLGPPAGEDEVGVDVLLPELLGDVEPQ